MTNFLMGKGVWPFINGDEQEPILGAAYCYRFEDIPHCIVVVQQVKIEALASNLVSSLFFELVK